MPSFEINLGMLNNGPVHAPLPNLRANMDALSQLVSWFFKLSITYICLTLSWNLAAARNGRTWPLNILCKILVVGGNAFTLYSLAIAFTVAFQQDQEETWDTPFALGTIFARRTAAIIDAAGKKLAHHASESFLGSFVLTIVLAVHWTCKSVRDAASAISPLAPIEHIFNAEDDAEMRKAAMLLVGILNIGVLVIMYATRVSSKQPIAMTVRAMKLLFRVSGMSRAYSGWVVPTASACLSMLRITSMYIRLLNRGYTSSNPPAQDGIHDFHPQSRTVPKTDEVEPVVLDPTPLVPAKPHQHVKFIPTSTKTHSRKYLVERITELIETIKAEREETRMRLIGLKASQDEKLADQTSELERLRRQLGNAHAAKNRLIEKLEEERAEAKEALKRGHDTHWTERGDLLERLEVEQVKHEEQCRRLREEFEAEIARLRARIDELVSQLKAAEQTANSFKTGHADDDIREKTTPAKAQPIRAFSLDLDLGLCESSEDIDPDARHQASILLLAVEKAELERKLVSLERANEGLVRQLPASGASIPHLKDQIARMNHVVLNLRGQLAEVRHILEREHAIVAQLSAERVRNSGLIRSLQEKAVSAQNELNAKASALSQELQKLEQKDKAISKLQDELQILRRKYINSASEWYKDQTAARQRLQESEKSLQLANGQLDEERTTSLGLRLDVERLTRKKNESDRLLAEIRGRLDKLQQGYVGVTLRNRSHGAPGPDGPASAQEHSRHGAASVAGPLILPQCLSRAGISTRTSADDLSAIDPRARTNPKAQPAKEFPSERTNVLLLPTASTGSELETQTIDTSDLLW